MEGNACYKFSTIKNFIAMTQAKDIEAVVDIGANIGDITLLIREYFPSTKIVAFEPVTEYFEVIRERTKAIAGITVYNQAVTAQHRYFDDFGKKRRRRPAKLAVLKARPEAGPGWVGGSMVVPEADERNGSAECYSKIADPVTPITLEEVMKREGFDEIDVLKIDCEGCEHSVLGSAKRNILRRVRFITGEYHDLDRFREVMQRKLFLTHKLNLIGERDLGCFFAERLDERKDAILRYDKSGMLIPRPWLCDKPIDWHLFDERFVLPQERYWHALP